MKTAAIVARFQVPYLHEGHLHLVNKAAEGASRLLFILGSPSVPDERNILPFVVRKEMVWDAFKHLHVHMHFEEILDHREDAEWSKHLDDILVKHPFPTLYGSRDSFFKFYTGIYPCTEVSEIMGFSGTQLREEKRFINSSEYRQGMIDGYNLKHATRQKEEKATK